jgi:hypothetical protein
MPAHKRLQPNRLQPKQTILKLRTDKSTNKNAKQKLKTGVDVFLNIPYDARFENLLLAYIAGISAFGFTPRATLEIPFSQRRLDRIIALIASSQYSVHDLSRVQLDNTAPRTPRFNMPFELGLTVGLASGKHVARRKADSKYAWIVCEARRHRIKKSLSDLDGTDVYIHDGTVRGVLRELCNAFVRNRRQPTVEQMLQIYRILRSKFASTLRAAGAKDPFNARVFRDLCVLASAAADELVAG